MTEIFLDTANIKDIKEIKSWGIIQGVTTNQKIFLKEKGCNFEKRAKDILETVFPLPVSLEGPNDYDGIIEVAMQYKEWKDDHDSVYNNIVVKVPMLGNGDGLRAVKKLREMQIPTNVTACMTLNQAFLSACAGATYISLFYNRMKDWYCEKTLLKEEEGTTYAISTIVNTMNMLRNSGFETELIVGSIRKPEDIEEILLGHPDIITIPTKILKQMPFNDKTEKTLKEFESAWNEFCEAEEK